MSVVVRRARGDETERALALRRAVFVDEQGVPLDEELDGRDDEAVHLVAIDPGGTVLGTCRLLVEGTTLKLGRMAVAACARRRGIGLALLNAADDEAAADGAQRITLAAQLDAVPLYARAGYVPRGDVFLDAGIEHVWMDKAHA